MSPPVKPTTFTLDNGLRVVLAPTRCKGQVRVQMVYAFGSNAERDDSERGLAHVVEHMVFKGTVGSVHGGQLAGKADIARSMGDLALSEQDITAVARLFGAKYNAFTTTNMTSYYFQVAPQFMRPFLEVLSTSMRSTGLKEQHLRSEKLAVLEEVSGARAQP